MKPIYREIGGLRINTKYGIFDITSPFAVLEIFDDEIIITTKVKKLYLHIYLFNRLFNPYKVIHLKIKEIDSVKRITRIPFISEGIKINHHADVPTFIFWNIGTVKKIVNILRLKGVTVE